MTLDAFDFNTVKHLIQPNEQGAYTATIAGSKCEIAPVRFQETWSVTVAGKPETWSVTVAGKLIVTETDELEHAWNHAITQAKQIEFNICGPR